MTNKLAKKEQNPIIRSITAKINEMITEGEIEVPANYSPMNAIKGAYLVLSETLTKDKQPVLEACTGESITNAILSMISQGLNPIKNQCYFIPYGNQLNFQRSYLGTIALTKRIPGVEDVKGFALWEGDEFEMGLDLLTGKPKIEAYTPSMDKKNLVGAFAIVIGKNEILHVEHMSKEQLQAAWNMGQTKGNSPAHKGFPDQMAIKTVINRACKTYANTSDDEGSVSAIFNRSPAVDVEEVVEIEQGQLALSADDMDVDPETGEILDFSKQPDGTPF